MDWRSIARGSLVGLAASVVVFAVVEALRHLVNGFADSGAESAVALLLIVCYFVGGYYAVRSKGTLARATGALAGLGVACLGFALSLAFWMLRDNGPWLSGNRAAHPAVVLIGPLIFGAVFGAFGGAWAKRHRRLTQGDK